MAETLYPTGYGKTLVTLVRLRDIYGPKMHLAYERRLFAWIEAQGGLIGIGSGWRAHQPNKPGFAPAGKSFHQTQTFASGFKGYCAVDLVARNGNDQKHRAPTWEEVPKQGTPSVAPYGVHCNVTGEPWHMQPVEIDGWQTWVDGGRRDPLLAYPLPKPPDPPKPPPPPLKGDDVVYVVRNRDTLTVWVSTGAWRYPLPSFEAYEALKFVAAKHGTPLPDFVDVAPEQLEGFGAPVGGA